MLLSNKALFVFCTEIRSVVTLNLLDLSIFSIKAVILLSSSLIMCIFASLFLKFICVVFTFTSLIKALISLKNSAFDL